MPLMMKQNVAGKSFLTFLFPFTKKKIKSIKRNVAPPLVSLVSLQISVRTKPKNQTLAVGDELMIQVCL